MTDILNTLFVYGTLKQGYLNAPLLEGCIETISPGTVRGLLYDVGLFPALVAGDGMVRGELVRVKPELWRSVVAVLDDLEEYRADDEDGSMYLRRVVTAHTESGENIAVSTYFYNRDLSTLRRIESGEWRGVATGSTRPADAERAAYEDHVRTFRERRR